MIKLPFWTPIHKILVKNQKLVRNLFSFGYIISSALILAGFYLYSFMTPVYIQVFERANKFGTFALILFLISFLPGILQRLRVFPLFTSSLMLFRRQIGILMYFFALVHSMYISVIPAIMTNQLGLENFSRGVLIGTLTLVILFPVWITSNDFFQLKLGKYWKTVQRLSYFAILALFFHISIVGDKRPILLIILSLLEIISWVKVWFFKPKRAKLQS